MSDFNNQKCSKCYSKYVGLAKYYSNYTSSCPDRYEHFFKKNGQLFCIDCLLAEGIIKCQKCRKLITRHDDLGKWVKYVVESGDHTCDVDDPSVFGGHCRDCDKKIEAEKNQSKPHYDGRGPGNLEWERKKNCRIAGCPYKVSPNFEAWGVCGVHVKKCQGTVFTHRNGGYKAKHGSTQFLPCTNVADEGDFCECCKGQTETYQQVKARIAAEEKQGFEKYEQVQAKAQSWWSTLSSHEREQECERVVENMKQEKYWANNVREGEGSGWACDGSFWILKNGKFTSSSPHLVPIQIIEEFMKKETLEYYDEVRVIDYFESSMVKVKKNDSDNSPLEIEEGERIGEKKLEIANNNKSNNEVLVIDLKNIKKLTLRNNNSLEIEFNSSIQDNQNVGHWYSVNQVMTEKQVNSNQWLQAVKNHLQKNNNNSLNQRELTEFFNSSSVPPETPKDINRLLKIGGGVVLVFGVLGWLLVVSKRKLKNH